MTTDVNRPASELMDSLVSCFPDERVRVDQLFGRLRGRGQGIVLLILALPMCLPNVPGISTLFGILLLPPAIQMTLRHKAVWLPGFIGRWRIKGDHLRKALRACSKVLHRIEPVARPRWTRLLGPRGLTYIGVQTLVMALVLIIPMPGANFIPGVAVVLSGLAILQRDGVLMVASIPVAIGALVWVYMGGKFAIDMVLWLTDWVTITVGRLLNV